MDDSYQFTLGVGRTLKVESADDSFLADGLIVLNERTYDTLAGEQGLIEGFEEMTTVILENARLIKHQARYRGGDEFHCQPGQLFLKRILNRSQRFRFFFISSS